MLIEIQKSNWVDFLMQFTKTNIGKGVKIYAEDDTGGRKSLGEGPLISFEGDCVGEIVRGVKVVIGEEGENPDNLFHMISSPQKIAVVENDHTGEIEQIYLESDDKIKTTIYI